MADKHHADLPEILGREAGQHLFVDLVCAKRRLVLLEPETTEPCRNVHAWPLRRSQCCCYSPYRKPPRHANTQEDLAKPSLVAYAPRPVVIGRLPAVVTV